MENYFRFLMEISDFLPKSLSLSVFFSKMLAFIRETYYGPKTSINMLSKLAQIASPL